MKIYYQIPESDNQEENKMMSLLYELFKYKIMWQLRTIEQDINKEGGIIFIDRDEEGPSFRYEGFSDSMNDCLHKLIGEMRVKSILK